jgi:hypothetical protein
VSIQTSKNTAGPGDELAVSLTVANSGDGGPVDVYLGALMPPDAGFSFGCPLLDAIAFVADGGSQIVTTCRSAPPQTFPPFMANASLPASMPEITLAPFWQFVLPPGLPPGAYTMFMVITPPGAFVDGRVDAADLLAVTTSTFIYAP